MRSTVALILVAFLVSSCAAQLWHGETETLDAQGNVIARTMHHGWNGVIGQGSTGASSTPNSTQVTTANTGFSDNAAPTIKAMGAAVGEGASEFVGTGVVNTLVSDDDAE